MSEIIIPTKDDGKVDFDQPVPGMAPPNLHWHRQYSKTFALFSENLIKLRDAEGFDEAEDLGDYVETIATLMSFRPHTAAEIEKDVYVELYGEDKVEADMAAARTALDNEED